MKRAALMIMVGTFAVIAGTAAAAGLSDGDYRYLKSEFGFARDGFVLANIDAAEQARLHDLINDPNAKGYPQIRNLNVADYLFNATMRTCQSWQLAHRGQDCPVVTDARAKPGWDVAQRNCNACHLTGTTDAPSFYKLSLRSGWTADKLAAAIASGHTMSPISLEPQQIQDLANYIASLK